MGDADLDVRFGSGADIPSAVLHVRFGPEAAILHPLSLSLIDCGLAQKKGPPRKEGPVAQYSHAAGNDVLGDSKRNRATKIRRFEVAGAASEMTRNQRAVFLPIRR